MPPVVRKQAITLGLGMGAGIVSFTVASLLQGVLRIDGTLIAFSLFGLLFLLILRFGPDGWR
jgi:hypothetical protein